MSRAPQILPPSNSLWKELGITVAKWADSTFLFGVGQLSTQVFSTLLKAIKQSKPPLDWAYPWLILYNNQDDLLWVTDQNNKRLVLPQVLLIGPAEIADEATVRVELIRAENFQAPMPVNAAWEFYRRTSDGGIRKQFFNGENARVVEWNALTRTLVFQGSWYFDYLKTNLALDVPIPIVGTLRQYVAEGGKLESLRASRLANAGGINGLIFTNDGHMIVQSRRDNVLIRPREICSGFSGTIDKSDIVHAIASGGTLAEFDAPREMVEELGINADEIVTRGFLGLTRELIRGGTPEMFYALDIALSADEVLGRMPKDREGFVNRVFLGPFAKVHLAEREADQLPHYFWSLIRHVQSSSKGPLSVPLLTNMVLWYQLACPSQSGTCALKDLDKAPAG